MIAGLGTARVAQQLRRLISGVRSGYSRTEKKTLTAVRTDSAGYKAIAYEKLTAVLTEGVKEQQREIETLKEQNAQLQQGLSELKALVESLRRN